MFFLFLSCYVLKSFIQLISARSLQLQVKSSIAIADWRKGGLTNCIEDYQTGCWLRKVWLSSKQQLTVHWHFRPFSVGRTRTLFVRSVEQKTCWHCCCCRCGWKVGLNLGEQAVGAWSKLGISGVFFRHSNSRKGMNSASIKIHGRVFCPPGCIVVL